MATKKTKGSIPGDGIGPEISEAVVAILDGLGAPFAWDRQLGGKAATKEFAQTVVKGLK